MELNIVYKNGERRHINLNGIFFLKENAVLDKRTADLTIDKRVVDLANDLGKDVFQISVFRGADTILEKKFVKNEPELSVVTDNIDERYIKKKLRREFKAQPFTQKLILSEGVWRDIRPFRKAA